MKFLFWQNVVSIHQSAFLKALSQEHEVTLVAAEKITVTRIADGWSVPDMGNTEIIVAPQETVIDRLLKDNSDTQHVFSGIDAYPMVYKAFRMAVKRGLNVSVMMEPYQWQGVKGFARRVKYSLHALRYGRHISHLFATGELGVRAFRKAGFDPEKIHMWGYFTEQPVEVVTVNERPRMIFVGSIDARKNILNLVDAAKGCSNLYDEFLIVGSGPLVPELKVKIKDEPKIHYLGSVPNGKVGKLISCSDLLVLPSLFDGWGAVVNEALAQGTRVLCSDNCGASSLLDNDSMGGCFKVGDSEDLADKLRFWLEKGALKKEQRTEIREWAEVNLSGGNAADYFSNVIDGKAEPGLTPWGGVNSLPSMIYVGRLDDNKNLSSILGIFDAIAPRISQFTIVGDGPLMSRFVKLAAKYDNIVFTGPLDNSTAKTMMACHDLLLLPSKYDGWGAVVNEALSVGTRVLCSQNCGAAVLLDGSTRGDIMDISDNGAITDKLSEWLDKGGIDDESRLELVRWSSEHISGSKAADYFVSVINGYTPREPWG